MEHAKVLWDELGLPALTPQPPWYGYSLGDWNETWDNWAKRAVEGKWEKTGVDTFARRAFASARRQSPDVHLRQRTGR